VASRLGSAGENVPLGKVNEGKQELFQNVRRIQNPQDIEQTIVNFFGNDVPTTISQIGKVVDTMEDEKTRTYVNGKKSIFLDAYKQSGSNSIAVVKDLKKQIEQINSELEREVGKPKIKMIRDTSVWIQNNVDDVRNP